MKRKPKKADNKAEPLTLYRADLSWILAICAVCYHCMEVAWCACRSSPMPEGHYVRTEGMNFPPKEITGFVEFEQLDSWLI